MIQTVGGLSVKAKHQNLAGTILGVIVLAIVGAGNASAAINACVSGPGQTIDNYNSTTNGCFQNDKVFSNFGVTGTSSDPVNNSFPTASQISLLGLSLGTYNPGDSTLTGVSVQFASTEWDICGTGGACANDVITSVINFQNGITPDQPAATLTGLSLTNVSVAGFLSGDEAILRLDVCFGATTTIAGTFDAASCNAAAGGSGTLGFIQYSYIDGLVPTITSSNANLSNLLAPSSISTWASRISITVDQGGTPNTEMSINSFDLSYDQAGVVPEPSTFGLLGLGLTGLVFAARRRKKA